MKPKKPYKRSTYGRPKTPDGHRLYAPYGHDTTIRLRGHLLTWKQMTKSEQGRTSKRIRGAHNRNKFWKALGYPNLQRARDAHQKYLAERVKAGLLSSKQTTRLNKIAAGELQPADAREAMTVDLFEAGKRERERGRPMLGVLLPAGLYDPA